MKTLIIIGAGAAGYTAAIMAAEKGCQVTLIEKEKLGGECVHRGCVPAKKYLRDAALFMETGIRPDVTKLQEETEELIGKLQYGIRYQLKKNGVQIKYGEATIMAPGVVSLSGELLKANAIFIATGSVPLTAKQISLSQKNRVYSMDEMFTSLQDLIQVQNGENLYILGAGAVGTEAAMIFSMLGAKVTLLEQAEHILPAMDQEITERLGIWMKEKGIRIRTGYRRFSDGRFSDDMFSDDRLHDHITAADKVLICCGRRPLCPACSKDVVLQKTVQGGICVNEKQETSCQGIYAIGDCTGIRMEANIARIQAERAVKHFLEKEICDTCQEKKFSGQKNDDAVSCIWTKRSLSVIPHCVYTPMEVLSAGVTSGEVLSWSRETGEELLEATAEMAVLAAGMIRKEEEGFCKVYFAKDSRKIRGVHLFCKNASLLSPFVQQILTEEMTLDMVKRMPFLHPTAAEIFAQLQE